MLDKSFKAVSKQKMKTFPSLEKDEDPPPRRLKIEEDPYRGYRLVKVSAPFADNVVSDTVAQRYVHVCQRHRRRNVS
jgi:hypothetical protein